MKAVICLVTKTEFKVMICSLFVVPCINFVEMCAFLLQQEDRLSFPVHASLHVIFVCFSEYCYHLLAVAESATAE